MSDPEVIEIRSEGDLAAIAESWRELAWNTNGTSFFQSPDWASAWWATLAGKPESLVAIWRDTAGRLDALAAVSRVQERIHRRVGVPISFWTNTGSGLGAADHVGPLVGRDREDDVRRWLEALDGSLVMRNVAPNAAYMPDRATVTQHTTRPRLTIPPADEPVGRSTKYRKRLRRNSRVLRERGLEFRAVEGPDITPDMVDRLMELHEVRSDDKGWGSTFTPERIEFHRRLIAGVDDGVGPGMMIANRDAEIVGVLYGFWWNASFSYFQTGWDPEWGELSLGSALVYEMVLHARSRGASLFDFLRGPEDYKYRFGAVDQVDEDWLVARGVSGRVLATKASLR